MNEDDAIVPSKVVIEIKLSPSIVFTFNCDVVTIGIACLDHHHHHHLHHHHHDACISSCSILESPTPSFPISLPVHDHVPVCFVPLTILIDKFNYLNGWKCARATTCSHTKMPNINNWRKRLRTLKHTPEHIACDSLSALCCPVCFFLRLLFSASNLIPLNYLLPTNDWFSTQLSLTLTHCRQIDLTYLYSWCVRSIVQLYDQNWKIKC